VLQHDPHRPLGRRRGPHRRGRAHPPPGGILLLYGPFHRQSHPTAPGNEAFDATLRTQNPAWGIRSLEAVAALAHNAGFAPPEITAMPANNLCVAWRRFP